MLQPSQTKFHFAEVHYAKRDSKHPVSAGEGSCVAEVENSELAHNSMHTMHTSHAMGFLDNACLVSSCISIFKAKLPGEAIRLYSYYKDRFPHLSYGFSGREKALNACGRITD